MKKLLALVLALVMTLSLVTISNAAFKDADKIDYDEAVTVMNAVGVLVGDENSNFNAKENLTRAQAAKIISYLLLGNKTAEALAGSGKFTDVAKNSWSAGFVDYCASTGVVNGVGDGKFDPNGQLTGYQFAKMLLVALGYDATIEGFTGADWQINVSKRADQADLFDNLDISGNAALTREQAAQMCLNTLKSPLVEYSNKGGNLTINGATLNIGASNAEYKTTSTKLSEQTIYANKLNSSAGEYIVEFAEQYYPELELKYSEDAFGRPCYQWFYDKKDLGTFADKGMLVETYVGKVTGKDLYDLLGKSVVEGSNKYDFFVYIDGVSTDVHDSKVFNETSINKNNKTAVGGTGTGVVTEVYVNNDAKDVYIVIINEYLARATADYDSKKETVKLNVYGLDEKSATVDGKTVKEFVKTKTDDVEDKETLVASLDDFALVADAKEDDAYVVTVAEGAIQSMVKAEVVEDTTLTSFKKGENVKADGTTYEYASAAEYNYEVLDKYTGTGRVNLKDTTYNIYLDTHGNLLGIDKVTTADNYVFIAGVQTNGSVIASKNADATAIFLDGTSKTIKVDTEDSTPSLIADNGLTNTWCTYTVDKNDVYTLTVVAAQINESASPKVKVAQYHDATEGGDIDVKHIALKGQNGTTTGYGYKGVYGNDDTVYLLAKVKKLSTNGIISGVESVATGVKNASLNAWSKTEITATGAKFDGMTTVSSGVYTLYKSNGYIIATVVVGEDNAASKNLVYVNSDSVEYEAYDKANDEWTWTRKVIIDGEEATITEVGSKLQYIGASMAKNGWYQVKYNAKGEVVGVLNDSTTDTWSLVTNNGSNAGDYVKNIANLNNAINGTGSKDTVLYSQGFNANVPTMKGSTLYAEKDLTQGFFVAEDAKIVFIQKNDGKTTTEYDTGAKAAQSFIESLNANKDSNPATYNYTISAILQNGAAKVVIIKDDADSTYTPGGSTSVVANGTVTVSYDPTTKKTSVASPVINSADVSNWDFSSGKMYVSTTVDGKEFPKDFTLDATKKLSAAITALGDDVAAVSMQGTGYQICTDVTLVFTGLDGNTYKLTGSTGVIFN